MTFTVSPAQFAGLEKELIDSHQVVIAGNDSAGTITSTNGWVAAKYSYDGSTLKVDLTKHDGIPGFMAEQGLKSKLNAAIKALPAA